MSFRDKLKGLARLALVGSVLAGTSGCLTTGKNYDHNASYFSRANALQRSHDLNDLTLGMAGTPYSPGELRRDSTPVTQTTVPAVNPVSTPIVRKPKTYPSFAYTDFADSNRDGYIALDEYLGKDKIDLEVGKPRKFVLWTVDAEKGNSRVEMHVYDSILGNLVTTSSMHNIDVSRTPPCLELTMNDVSAGHAYEIHWTVNGEPAGLTRFRVKPLTQSN